MRIRSIRPEFWSSEDIAALDWPARLIFIGLWSYVDDNGVGRDIEKLIVADLFPLEDDTHGALKQVAGALKQLETGGQITRYVVDGKPWLHITKWEKHQVINRPSTSRYPLPTCGNAEARADDMSPHGDLTEPSLPGEGEKGRRGEGEKAPSSADADGDFAAFWTLYPRKISKGQAHKAWNAALKKADPATITAGLQAQLPAMTQADPKFIPHASTWLNGERWSDEAQAQPVTREQGAWWA